MRMVSEEERNGVWERNEVLGVALVAFWRRSLDVAWMSLDTELLRSETTRCPQVCLAMRSGLQPHIPSRYNMIGRLTGHRDPRHVSRPITLPLSLSYPSIIRPPLPARTLPHLP